MDRRATSPPPRVDAAVGRFMLGSLAAIAVVVVGGFFALRDVAIDEATGDTRDRVRAEARLVEAAGLSDDIVRGRPTRRCARRTAPNCCSRSTSASARSTPRAASCCARSRRRSSAA